ncbi:MAG: hypothetical protein ACFFAK_10135 [Promethearchaeota archaeon]
MKQHIQKDEKSKQDRTTPQKTKITNDKKPKSKSIENFELHVPPIPEAPKKKDKLTANSPGLSTDLLEKIKKLKSKDNQVVLVNCERCAGVIPIPIPKKIVLKSKLPVVPVSFIHKNPMGKDQHCITVHLDHDFDIRRQRISDIVISLD